MNIHSSGTWEIFKAYKFEINLHELSEHLEKGIAEQKRSDSTETDPSGNFKVLESTQQCLHIFLQTLSLLPGQPR